MTDVVTRLVVRADGSLAVLDQFGNKMEAAGQAADVATGGVARFEAAQKRMMDAQQRGLAITTENIARRTKEQRVFEQAASSIDRQFALRIRLEREAEKSSVAMSNAVAMGYLRQEQALEILMRQEQQHAAMLSQSGRPGVAGSSSFNTANIAAQFQDIGVTAAMGMNPLQIALQQGTQLSAVFATMERPLAGIAAGLKSIFSPLSLITIGLIALVAAGLQFVDWGSVAQATLNFLADGLELIAPYAAAAAVGLALLYSPAILAGLGTAVGALGTMATAIWGVATAIYATVGLPALLIAGFVAIVAGAVIWRDELTKMLGVDIVGAAEDGINWIVGTFVGGFRGIQVLWMNLPAVLGDIAIQAAQAVVDGVTTMLNDSRTQVLSFLSWVSSLPLPGVNSLALAGVGALSDAGELASPEIYNANEGKASAVFDFAKGTMEDAHSVNYLGEATTFVQNAASGAADTLRGLADSIGVDAKASKAAAKEADRQAKAYRDLTTDAHQFIAEQFLEAQALGMTEEAANRLRYEQEMLNKAANDNIALSPAQREEIASLAEQMAAAEERTRSLSESFNFGRDVFKGFFSDLRQGLKEGDSLWEAFFNAASNAIDKLLDKAMDAALDQVWNGLWGSIMGAFGGGSGLTGNTLGGGLSTILNARGNVYSSPGLSAYSNEIYDRPQMFAFAKGAGIFAEAGPEAIMPLGRDGAGRLGVRVANQNGTPAANSNVRVEIHNYSGQPVEQEQTKGADGVDITRIIIGTVSEAIAGGTLDPIMGATYGMKRKGA